MTRSLAILVLSGLACLPSCTPQPEARPAPDETDFTLWLVRTVAPDDAQAQRLCSRWEALRKAARELAPLPAPTRESSPAWRANAQEAQALLAEARRFLHTTRSAVRLVFNVERQQSAARAAAEEKWELRVGEKRLVLLEIANKTEEPISVALSGCASGGFYVWPWDRALAAKESLFSLLRVEPLVPGDKEGFIALDATSAHGNQVRSEIKLRGRFAPAPERMPPADRREVTLRTTLDGRPRPAVIELSTGQGRPDVLLLSEGHATLRGERVIVYSPGAVRVAVPPAAFTAEAHSGPALRAEPRTIDPAVANEASLALLEAEAQSWLRAWSAATFLPFAPEQTDLGAALHVLNAEGFAVGHLGAAPGDASFGHYPVTLTESLGPGGAIAVWSVERVNERLGSLRALNLVALKSRMAANLPGAGDVADLLQVCDEIHNGGGTTIGLAGPELPLLALLGKLDALVISTESMPLWYDLLSCGLRLAPAALQDGALCRTYVYLPRAFTYERYLRGLATGATFVTTGPLIDLRVNDHVPGDEFSSAEHEELKIRCSAWERGRETPVEIVVNGKVIGRGGTLAWRSDESAWIAARAPNAHTAPIYVTVDDRKPFFVPAAERLLGRLDQLERGIGAAPADDGAAASLPRELARGREILSARLNAPRASDRWERERLRMVQVQLRQRGVSDERVLRAMEKVPRHRFVPESIAGSDVKTCYADHPLPIGWGQTISQPYIVAFMTEALALDGHEKVLEIGTGSGYQAAVLGELAREVYTIEIVELLGKRAEKTLRELNYRNVHVRIGDGYRGWPSEQPFDAIIVTAAPDHVPPDLVAQLAPGGRMVVPVGTYMQELKIIVKNDKGEVSERDTMPVLFVPMTGEAQSKK